MSHIPITTRSGSDVCTLLVGRCVGRGDARVSCTTYVECMCVQSRSELIVHTTSSASLNRTGRTGVDLGLPGTLSSLVSIWCSVKLTRAGCRNPCSFSFSHRGMSVASDSVRLRIGSVLIRPLIPISDAKGVIALSGRAMDSVYEGLVTKCGNEALRSLLKKLWSISESATSRRDNRDTECAFECSLFDRWADRKLLDM